MSLLGKTVIRTGWITNLETGTIKEVEVEGTIVREEYKGSHVIVVWSDPIKGHQECIDLKQPGTRIVE